MANYFYFDQNNQKQGPVSWEELQALAAQGVIEPNMKIETSNGGEGFAGQLVSPSKLKFKELRVTPQSSSGSVWTWLFDFAFRDIRIHTVILWFCRIFYTLSVIATICLGLWATFMLFVALSYRNALALLGIPIVWVGVVLSIFLARLYCESIIFVYDWIHETTKAARLYIENNKKE